MNENKGLVHLGLKLPADVLNEVDRKIEKEYATRSEYIRELIRRDLAA